MKDTTHQTHYLFHLRRYTFTLPTISPPYSLLLTSNKKVYLVQQKNEPLHESNVHLPQNAPQSDTDLSRFPLAVTQTGHVLVLPKDSSAHLTAPHLVVWGYLTVGLSDLGWGKRRVRECYSKLRESHWERLLYRRFQSPLFSDLSFT
jgi:hypothetical protein